MIFSLVPYSIFYGYTSLNENDNKRPPLEAFRAPFGRKTGRQIDTTNPRGKRSLKEHSARLTFMIHDDHGARLVCRQFHDFMTITA